MNSVEIYIMTAEMLGFMGSKGHTKKDGDGMAVLLET
jgi:hypothetical protein